MFLQKTEEKRAWLRKKTNLIKKNIKKHLRFCAFINYNYIGNKTYYHDKN